MGDQLKLHGLPVALLAFGLWYFQQDNQKLNHKLQECHNEIIRLYREDREQTKDLIINHTQALKELTTSINNLESWETKKQRNNRGN
jgi:hypothetical protein